MTQVPQFRVLPLRAYVNPTLEMDKCPLDDVSLGDISSTPSEASPLRPDFIVLDSWGNALSVAPPTGWDIPLSAYGPWQRNGPFSPLYRPRHFPDSDIENMIQERLRHITGPGSPPATPVIDALVPHFPHPDNSIAYRDPLARLWRCCGCGWGQWTTYRGLRGHQGLALCGWDSSATRLGTHRSRGFDWSRSGSSRRPRRNSDNSDARSRSPPVLVSRDPSTSLDTLDVIYPPAPRDHQVSSSMLRTLLLRPPSPADVTLGPHAGRNGPAGAPAGASATGHSPASR
ncbi:unnamed protein product [Lota lota]